MAKSAQRRKKGRQTRHQHAAIRQRARTAKQAAERRARLIGDPAADPGEVAELLLDGAETLPVSHLLAQQLASHGRDPAGMTAIVDAMRERAPDSLAALTFAAAVAHEAGRADEARKLLDVAMERSHDWDVRLDLVRHLSHHGRRAEAAEAARQLTREDPTGDADVVMGYALEALPETHPVRMAAADRSLLYRLREAVDSYVTRNLYTAETLQDRVEQWRETIGMTDAWDGSPEAQLAVEHALLMDDDDGDIPSPYVMFADEPDTPPELAAAARECNGATYGLWRVEDTTAAPGLHLLDLVTGVERYVLPAQEQTAHLARWSVLLGAIAPVDGIWRTMSSLVQLSPAEGDRCADAVLERGNDVLMALERDAGLTSASYFDAHIGRPHGVLADTVEPLDPGIARILSMVIGIALPDLLAEVVAARNAPPTLVNTDGHPVIEIDATINLTRPAETRLRLLEHPDIALGDDGALIWWGEEIPPETAAQQRAQLGLSQTGTPGRWLRAQLALDGPTLVTHVNSRKRLEMLLELLRWAGDSPAVADESRIDPIADRAWPPAGGGPSALSPAVTPEWLDASLPALGGLTPRAAASGVGVHELERLLRQWEFTRDAGGVAPDTEWIRAELGLPDIY